MSTIVLLSGFVFSTLALQGSFVVMGTVQNTEGNAVDSIRVSLMDENYQILKTVFTDPSGRFRFPAVRSGVYTVTITPTGTPYEETSQRIDLQSLSGARGGRAPGGQEPVHVELVVRRKKLIGQNRTNEVVFAQDIPDFARAEYKRATTSIRNDKVDEGISALKKAVEIYPDYFLALELLGTEYVKLGKFTDGVPVLTHALKLNRNAPKSLYALGVAYLKLGRPAEAAELLRDAAHQDGNNANVYMMLGLACGYNKAFEEAELSLKKAYELGGDKVAEAHWYLAGIYNQQKRYSDAIRELETYLKEAKDADPAKVKEMINKLKAKRNLGKSN